MVAYDFHVDKLTLVVGDGLIKAGSASRGNSTEGGSSIDVIGASGLPAAGPGQPAPDPGEPGPGPAGPDWERPGAYEVAAGIFRIPLPLPTDGLRAVNVYAVVSEHGLALIDGGWAVAEAETQLRAALDLIGFGLEHITDFFVTHAHRDHYTLAAQLRRSWNTRISIGAGERASMHQLAVRTEYADPSSVPLLVRAGAGRLADALRAAETPFDRSVWSLPDAWLEDGEILRLDDRRTLTVLHTPGHTRGHIVFVDGEHGVVFAGDHVLPHITPSVGYEEVPPPSPLAGYLTSLALLRQLPDARLLPAHGPVAPSVHQRVDELLDHHARRLELTVRPLARNALTGYEVARALRWTRRERAFDELDPFNQALATLETVAHLEVLAERGRVTRLDDASGVRRYRA